MPGSSKQQSFARKLAGVHVDPQDDGGSDGVEPFCSAEATAAAMALESPAGDSPPRERGKSWMAEGGEGSGGRQTTLPRAWSLPSPKGAAGDQQQRQLGTRKSETSGGAREHEDLRPTPPQPPPPWHDGPSSAKPPRPPVLRKATSHQVRVQSQLSTGAAPRPEPIGPAASEPPPIKTGQPAAAASKLLPLAHLKDSKLSMREKVYLGDTLGAGAGAAAASEDPSSSVQPFRSAEATAAALALDSPGDAATSSAGRPAPWEEDAEGGEGPRGRAAERVPSSGNQRAWSLPSSRGEAREREDLAAGPNPGRAAGGGVAAAAGMGAGPVSAEPQPRGRSVPRPVSATLTTPGATTRGASPSGGGAATGAPAPRRPLSAGSGGSGGAASEAAGGVIGLIRGLLKRSPSNKIAPSDGGGSVSGRGRQSSSSGGGGGGSDRPSPEVPLGSRGDRGSGGGTVGPEGRGQHGDTAVVPVAQRRRSSAAEPGNTPVLVTPETHEDRGSRDGAASERGSRNGLLGRWQGSRGGDVHERGGGSKVGPSHT